MRYFQWKCHSNISDISYEKLRKLLKISGVHIKSLRITRRYLQSTLGISIKHYHRCINNCMIFIGENLLRRRCQYCTITRFHDDRNSSTENDYFDNIEAYSQLIPRALYSYISLIPRLKLLYANPVLSKKMRYPQELEEDPWMEDGIRDVWEGARLKELKEKGNSKSD